MVAVVRYRLSIDIPLCLGVICRGNAGQLHLERSGLVRADAVRLCGEADACGCAGRITQLNLFETIIEQLARIRKALVITRRFHDDRNNAAAIADCCCGHTVAGSGDGAGLEAIQALIGGHGVEQMVGVVIIGTVEAVAALAGDPQDVRIGVDEFLGQRCLRAGGDVIGLCAVAVIVGRIQAKILGSLVHAGNECTLAAADVLSHGDAGRAGRRDHDQVQQGLHRIGGALGQRNSSRIIGVTRLDRYIMADADRCFKCQPAGLQFLIDDVGSQYLGHAGGYAGNIAVVGI